MVNRTIYNIMLNCAQATFRLGAMLPDSPVTNAKVMSFMRGNTHAIEEAASGFTSGSGLNFWVHCASLGEYAIACPIMKALKERHPDCRICLTFFSPTGVEAIRRKEQTPADFTGFLPADTRGNARRMLDIIKPSAAIFMVSEYWPNYLLELKARDIPTFLVSNIFTPGAPHHNAIAGGLFRKSLEAYTRIYTLNNRSKEHLAALGYNRACVMGDPLVDNAVAVAATPWHDEVLESFCGSGRVMIAGSITDDNDIRLVAAEVNAHPERKYILVPHEVDEAHIAALESALSVPFARLSRYETGKTDVNVIIVDHVGSLARLYRLGAYAYIGGGFTSQLHSLLEAVVYGLPVAMGPRTERKVTPAQLRALGVAEITGSPEEFRAWCDAMYDAPASRLEEIRHRALEFSRANTGATEAIVSDILRQIREK